MTKHLCHNALDAAFAYVSSRADRLCLCQGGPETALEAMTSPARGGRLLGMSVLGPGDFAVEPGQRSGRRLVVDACPPVTIRNAGLADHLALIDAQAGEVLIVLPLAQAQSVAPGAVVTVNRFFDEILDPA